MLNCSTKTKLLSGRGLHSNRARVKGHASRKPRDVQRDERDSTGPPAWKQYARKDKALGKQAEATLEMIWSKTEWLTEEHIQGMWDNHRVRRDVVIDWFMKKRRTSRKQQGGP
ncbi:hypothetical protein M9434_001506 [Picochlorum sp. BPE23]|nr:hypothetical protein M9434_001506 [Picochlorum sp. BPE23]